MFFCLKSQEGFCLGRDALLTEMFFSFDEPTTRERGATNLHTQDPRHLGCTAYGRRLHRREGFGGNSGGVGGSKKVVIRSAAAVAAAAAINVLRFLFLRHGHRPYACPRRTPALMQDFI